MRLGLAFCFALSACSADTFSVDVPAGDLAILAVIDESGSLLHGSISRTPIRDSFDADRKGIAVFAMGARDLLDLDGQPLSDAMLASIRVELGTGTRRCPLARDVAPQRIAPGDRCGVPKFAQRTIEGEVSPTTAERLELVVPGENPCRAPITDPGEELQIRFFGPSEELPMDTIALAKDGTIAGFSKLQSFVVDASGDRLVRPIDIGHPISAFALNDGTYGVLATDQDHSTRLHHLDGELVRVSTQEVARGATGFSSDAPGSFFLSENGRLEVCDQSCVELALIQAPLRGVSEADGVLALLSGEKSVLLLEAAGWTSEQAQSASISAGQITHVRGVSPYRALDFPDPVGASYLYRGDLYVAFLLSESVRVAVVRGASEVMRGGPYQVEDVHTVEGSSDGVTFFEHTGGLALNHRPSTPPVSLDPARLFELLVTPYNRMALRQIAAVPGWSAFRVRSGAIYRQSTLTSTTPKVFGPDPRVRPPRALLHRDGELYVVTDGAIEVLSSDLELESKSIQGFSSTDVVTGAVLDGDQAILIGYEAQEEVAFLRRVDLDTFESTAIDVVQHERGFFGIAKLAEGKFLLLGEQGKAFLLSGSTLSDVRITWKRLIEHINGECSGVLNAGFWTLKPWRRIESSMGVAFATGCDDTVVRFELLGSEVLAEELLVPKEVWLDPRVNHHLTALDVSCPDQVMIATESTGRPKGEFLSLGVSCGGSGLARVGGLDVCRESRVAAFGAESEVATPLDILDSPIGPITLNDLGEVLRAHPDHATEFKAPIPGALLAEDDAGHIVAAMVDGWYAVLSD